VVGVSLQVAFIPTRFPQAACRGGRGRINGARRIVEDDLHAVVAAPWVDLGEAERQVPSAGLNRSSQVAGGSVVGRHEDSFSGAAAPAAKTFARREGPQPGVEEAQVEDATFVKAVAHLDAGRPGRHLEREEAKGVLLCLSETIFEDVLPHTNIPSMRGKISISMKQRATAGTSSGTISATPASSIASTVRLMA
jgi:hypothetical protein